MAENNEKEYLDSLGLIRLVANIINKFATKTETQAKVDALQSSIDSVDSAVDNIQSGSIVVKEAEHADSADTATNANHAASADSATNANHAGSATTAENATHATSADTATNATTADKVSKSMTVQLNGGTTEGTDKFTYNGSVVKSLNITPGNIGAYTKGEVDSALSSKASSTHNHDDKYDAKNTASNAVSSHNTNTSAHSDIRDLITGLTNRLNAVANSTDTDLDTLAEIVAYIKSNKSLIDSVTTNKVNVSDIVNNLTTNVSNKPLSAAQGVALKSLIDGKANTSDIPTIDSAMSSTSANPVQNKVIYNQLSLILKDIDEANGNIDSLESQVAALDSAMDTHKHDASGVNFSDKNTTYATGVTVQAAVESLDVALENKADNSHTHTIANVTNLQSALDGKAASSHTHDISNVTGLQTELNNINSSLTAIDNNTVDAICGSSIVAASEVDL